MELEGMLQAHAVTAFGLRVASNLAALPGVQHAFTGRRGGVSEGPYASLNLGGTTDDRPEKVAENRRRLLAALDRRAASWVAAKQVHGDHVAEVGADLPEIAEADALLTRDKRVTLAICVADCVPLVIADRKGTVLACVHAGWRGTAANIAGKTVAACCRVGHVDPGELVAAVGPAIGPCCFEVGESVADTLRMGCPSFTVAGEAVSQGGGKWHADLWRLNLASLEAAGVLKQNVQIFRQCTACTTEFFSYRRDGGITGRQAIVAGLR